MFGPLGFQEILIILVIIFLLFGVKRLPEIGKSLGETMREIGKVRDEKKTGKEGKIDKENQKGNLISEIKKEVEEIPGLKQARELKQAADRVKSITKNLK